MEQETARVFPGRHPRSYSTPATTSSDNGAQIHVVVSNTAGTVTSQHGDTFRNSNGGPAFELDPAI